MFFFLLEDKNHDQHHIDKTRLERVSYADSSPLHKKTCQHNKNVVYIRAAV